jgi:hypothetical protein
MQTVAAAYTYRNENNVSSFSSSVSSEVKWCNETLKIEIKWWTNDVKG